VIPITAAVAVIGGGSSNTTGAMGNDASGYCVTVPGGKQQHRP
jgi:hypothetical protein